MCMFAATGTVQELDAPGFAVIGNAPAVVIAGTGAIGDSKSSSSSCDKTNCYCHFFPEFDTILRQVFDIQFVAILVFAIQIL